MMIKRMLTLGSTGVLLAGSAFAQDAKPQDWVDASEAKTALPADKSGEIPQGWIHKAKIGANTSYTHNSKVVGLDDGSYFQLGVLFDAESSLHTTNHAWENTLQLKHQQSKTPTLEQFVKSADELKIQSVYRYYFDTVKWVGPYARAKMTTAIIQSELVRSADTEVRRLDAQGVEEAGAEPSVLTPDNGVFHELLPAQEARKLTSGFEPLIFRQSAGAFVQPEPSKKLKSSFTFGAGAQEVLTDGGYVVSDDPDTEQLEIKRLQSFNEIGAEIDIEASGDIDESLGWNASLNVLFPFVTTADTDLSGTDLINTEFNAKLSARLSKWASVDYVFTAKKIPLVLDEWQVQNNLLLTASFSVL